MKVKMFRQACVLLLATGALAVADRGGDNQSGEVLPGWIREWMVAYCINKFLFPQFNYLSTALYSRLAMHLQCPSEEAGGAASQISDATCTEVDHGVGGFVSFCQLLFRDVVARQCPTVTNLLDCEEQPLFAVSIYLLPSRGFRI
jgi:hypothetical protein